MMIANGRSRGMGDAAAKVALMTALTESKLWMYANSTVPESLDYEHDRVGNDHDSLNFFQQRLSWGGNGTRAQQVKNLMNKDYAINAFYGALDETRGWRDLDPGVAAQKVQVSEFPDRYAEWSAAADAILARYPR